MTNTNQGNFLSFLRNTADADSATYNEAIIAANLALGGTATHFNGAFIELCENITGESYNSLPEAQNGLAAYYNVPRFGDVGGVIGNYLEHDFASKGTLPTGFSMSSGDAEFSDSGIRLSGSNSIFRDIDGTETYIDLSKPGFLIIVFTPREMPNSSVDDWLIGINNGSTSQPQLAARIYRDSGGGAHKPRLFFQPGTAPNASTYGELEAQVGVPMFCAVTWTDDAHVSIYTDDGGIDRHYDEIGPITNDGTLDKITVGDDHNGGANFIGTVNKIVVGYKDLELTLPEVVRFSFIEGDFPILIEGQSYQSQIYDSNQSGTPVGHQSAMLEASKHLPANNKIYLVNGAYSGSALLKSSASDDNWWLDNTQGDLIAGNRQELSEANEVLDGLQPRAVWWAQYQGDVFDIASGATTIEDYKAGLEWKIARWQEQFNDNVIILLEIPGGRNEAVSDETDEAHQSMREAYIDVVNNSSANVIRMEGYDIPYADTTGHPTDAGQVTRCARAIRRIFRENGTIDSSGISYGPNILTKGGFNLGTGWTQGGYVVSGSAATGFVTDNYAEVEADTTYEVTFTISNYVSGSVRVLLYGTGSAGVGTTRSSDGTFTQEITVPAAGAGSAYATIQVISAFTGDIDLASFTVKKKQTQGTVGPAYASGSASGSTILINITHDTGTDINNPTSFEGFKVFKPNGDELTITNVTRSDADTISINMAANITDLSVTVKYPYGALEGVDQVNLVYDNSDEAMPLQSFTVTLPVT